MRTQVFKTRSSLWLPSRWGPRRVTKGDKRVGSGKGIGGQTLKNMKPGFGDFLKSQAAKAEGAGATPTPRPDEEAPSKDVKALLVSLKKGLKADTGDPFDEDASDEEQVAKTRFVDFNQMSLHDPGRFLHQEAK